MGSFQILFGALYIALTAIFVYLALIRISRGIARIFWITFAILTAIAGIPNFVPTTPQNNIRLDLLVVNFALAPIFTIVAAVAIWMSLVRQLRRNKSGESAEPVRPHP